jgi:hypothetical protein
VFLVLRIKKVNSTFSDLRTAHRSARRQASLGRILSKHAFGGPLDQAVRWHLFYDGRRVISVVAQGTGAAIIWSRGPALEPADLGKSDRLRTLVGELSEGLKLSRSNHTSLGVVLHLADDIDVGIVQQGYQNPELFAQARTLVREIPSDVVTDLSTDQDPAIQWRYYPLLSGQRAVVLRHQIEFFSALQTLTDLEIKVAVHSAPIEMLALYLKLYAEAIEEKPHCFVLFYDRFTVVIPANQGVLDIKVLPHRQQEVPPTFGDDLFSLLERFGLVDSCVLLLVQCGTQEPTRLFRELDAYARRNQKNADGIEIQIPDKETVWATLDEFAPGKAKSEIIQRPEFLTEYIERTEKEFPLALGIKSDAQRFGILSRETYWPDDQKTRDQQLPQSLALGMTVLRAGGILCLLCLFGMAAWLGYSIFEASHGDPLHLVPEMVTSKQTELRQLQETRQYLTLWDNVLTPRSQAWSVMDLFLALIPEGHDVVCDRLKYALRQIELKAGAAKDKNTGGFLREWTAEGSCTDQGRDHLERLREGSTVSKIFASAALRLSDSSFGVSENRIIKVVLREETNPQFAGTGKTGVLPYQFRLVVTQTFAGSDPLAIPMMPRPKSSMAAR